MPMFFLCLAFVALSIPLSTCAHPDGNSTYTNPILPGWHSDPSCIYADQFDTFLCATSSFLTFPGMPVYASKDLMNWRLASHAFAREEQFLPLVNTTVQYGGLWAPSIRYHDGVYYLATTYTPVEPFVVTCLIFKTTNPFDDSAWSEPLVFPLTDIDADLFWDDDGQVYIHYAGIRQQTIDLDTGELGPVRYIWNGTLNRLPEGPHIYPRDGFYYLLISENGTEVGHTISVARSRNISGPYESYEGNPLLTSSMTGNYFQTVGHGDLFRDASGNWWSSALATRSGPAWTNLPMGRETVLVPARWDDTYGSWPVLGPVFGEMSGWPLPPPSRDVRGKGPFVEDPDIEDFAPGSSMPPHFLYWRFPPEDAFAISPSGHPNTLRLRSSKANLTSNAELGMTAEQSLIMRVQTDTMFSFSIDVVSFKPTDAEEEVGLTVFASQTQHFDLGIVNLPSSEVSSNASSDGLGPHLRFRVTALTGNFDGTPPPTVIRPIPREWLEGSVRLYAEAVNATHYSFAAASAENPSEKLRFGMAPATILSYGDARFSGALVGAYATSNGGSGTVEAYVSRWRYYGKGQQIGFDEYVPYTPYTKEV